MDKSIGQFDFDEIVPRRGTGSVKWDSLPPGSLSSLGTPGNVIPLWVADMDFRAAPAILQAVQQRAAHGVFGYTEVGEAYYYAIIGWFQRRHRWNIQREEIIYTTGVVPAVSAALQALTMHGEKVLIFSPAYNCFFSSIRNSGCEVLESPLRSMGAAPFEVDWADFEAKCADEKTTVFLLCNPHNPTGRVWTADELRRMNDICLRHGVKVVSDEIHCELIMPGHRFQPFAAVSEECRQNSVVLNSPSKSFNIAGLQIANIICAVPEWRRRIDRAVNINEVCDVNPFGVIALQAAYSDEGEAWLDELNQYIYGNYQMAKQMLEESHPKCPVTELEGTYLMWVNIAATGKTSEEVAHHLLHHHKVRVNPGTMYGQTAGEGYIRINLATRRELVEEGILRIMCGLSSF
jgi:cystathionine beta-lyase